MKNLYRLFCLFLLATSIISCSNDDEIALDTNGEKIIGTWHILKIEKNDEPLDIGTCLPQSTVEFKKNKTFITLSVSEGFDGECVDEEPLTGQWEYLGDNKFKTIINAEEEVVRIIFSKNGTVFNITEEEAGTVTIITYTKIN